MNIERASVYILVYRCCDVLATSLTTAAIMCQVLVLRGDVSVSRERLLRVVRRQEVPGAGPRPPVHLLPRRRALPRQRVHHPRPESTLRTRAA